MVKILMLQDYQEYKKGDVVSLNVNIALHYIAIFKAKPFTGVKECLKKTPLLCGLVAQSKAFSIPPKVS